MSDKLDEIEAIVNTPGEPWPDMYVDLRLLIRAVRQLGVTVNRMRLERDKNAAARHAIRDMKDAIQTSDEHYDALLAKFFDRGSVLEQDVLELIEEANE